ncbi:hypothetical protein B0H14DRAFT_3589793 [Mycena olivaceomarginata]|nr:hypothetical protein B0H14DRAFT_3589793 [Mycena olivaceomarginata]
MTIPIRQHALFNSLARETIAEIWTWLPRKSRSFLPSVCRAWRTETEGNKLLWTELVFTPASKETDRIPAQNWIVRSDPLTLSICISRDPAKIEASNSSVIRADQWAPYALSPMLEGGEAPWGGNSKSGAAPYHDQYGGSSAALLLAAHALPFQRTELYKRDDAGYNERGSLRWVSDSDFDARRRYTNARGGDKERETASKFGSESYPPSRNMFGAETSAWRRWTFLRRCLTRWVPDFLLT